MGWRILDLTNLHGEVGFSKRSRKLTIASFDTGEITEHSLVDVNIMFVGIGVSLRAGVVSHLTSQDVVVLFCDWKGVPVSGMYPWVDAHGRVATRQRAQAKLSEPRTKNAWMRVVKAKIRGQASDLDALGRDGGDRLREIASSTRSGDPKNCEALAARYYWHRIFGDPGFARKPGERSDPLNAMLDYGYTILRGHSMRAVLAAGLTPALGLYHHGRSNSFALADDLIEPFRPAVDLTVARLGARFDVSDRKARVAILQSTLQPFSPLRETIPTVMVELAQTYGQYVEGELRYLSVSEWEAPRGGDMYVSEV